MELKNDFVDCKAIKKALDENLPDAVKVVSVWEGTMRNDKTFKVYVKITQVDDEFPTFFTECVLDNMQSVIGKLLDVEIKDAKTLEFGFALPITSHYYLKK